MNMNTDMDMETDMSMDMHASYGHEEATSAIHGPRSPPSSSKRASLPTTLRRLCTISSYSRFCACECAGLLHAWHVATSMVECLLRSWSCSRFCAPR